MIQTAVRYGIQTAGEETFEPEDLSTTVGQQIHSLLADRQPDRVTNQIREALKNPQSVIEVRSGKQVQTVTPDTPVRELLAPDSDELEIAVSQPHAGG